MKRSKKRLWRLAVIAAALLLFVRSQRAPSEAEMLADFQQHRAVFQRLVAMARADHLDYLSGQHGFTDAHNKALPQARFDQYQKLLQQTRATHIILYHSRPSVYTFPVFGGGMTDTSWAVGYAWSDKPLSFNRFFCL